MLSIFSSTRGEKKFYDRFSLFTAKDWGIKHGSYFIYCSWFFSNLLRCKKSHWIYYLLLHKGRLVMLEILDMWNKIVTEAKQMRVNHLHTIQYFLLLLCQPFTLDTCICHHTDLMKQRKHIFKMQSPEVIIGINLLKLPIQ